MRLAFVFVGVLAALGGSVWALQGAGLIQGSFMSNDPRWIGIGAGTLLAGLGLVAFGFRSGGGSKKV